MFLNRNKNQYQKDTSFPKFKIFKNFNKNVISFYRKVDYKTQFLDKMIKYI